MVQRTRGFSALSKVISFSLVQPNFSKEKDKDKYKNMPYLQLLGTLRPLIDIPDICHFFTRAKFLENKIYTEKTRKLRQNTQKFANFSR